MIHTSSHSTKTPSTKLNVLDYVDEGRLTEWFTHYGKIILYSLAGLVTVIILIFTWSSRQNSQNEQNYIQAASDFNFLVTANDVQNSAPAQEALKRLQNAMQQHPELHAAYDGGLAQLLLNQSLPEEALPYATATLTRVKSNNLPFYTEYAETTLLISQQEYTQALKNALALQKKMEDALTLPAAERPFKEELFALNLLRIGILQQTAGDTEGEWSTWKTWKQYAGLSGTTTATAIHPQAFRAVIQQLAIGSISLPDYIAHRERLLKKS